MVPFPLDSAQAPIRVALVHDFLVDVRGAERVFLEMCRMWPQADIYTAVYDEQGTEGRFAGRRIYTSFLQQLRPTSRNFRALFPLYPTAIESFDFSGYDLVLSSSSAWAHGVLCDEQTVHVSYCHNPFRYAWNDREATLTSRRNPIVRAFLRGAFRRWRQWDWLAAQRTHRYVANSRITQARVRTYFGRDSTIVYPAVETDRFSPGRVGEHYATLSELMPHKQLDVAIAAFNHLRLPLLVIGDGPASRTLRKMAGPTITFTGRLADADVAELMQRSRALILTSIEEFGIAAVEAQAAGRPVIARRGGGALETVIEGVTGTFWSGGAADLVQAVLRFDDRAIDPEVCVGNAARFDAANFRRGLLEEVDAALGGDPRPAVAGRQPLASTRLVRRAVRDAHG